MNKQEFVSEILNFSDNKLNYMAKETEDGDPGISFVLREKGEPNSFTWRDYEIEAMQRTTAIDIGYCLSRAYDIMKWGD